MQALGSLKRLCSASEHDGQENCGEEAPRLKRCQSASGASGASGAEAARWLEVQGLTGLAALPQQPFWLAVADLNITLAAFQHTFAELRLLEQHNFTKCDKALAFEKVKLAFARGVTSAAALAQQPHLQAVQAVLDTALRACSDAAISQVTLLCPPFLAAWAQRWMPGPDGAAPPRLSLTVVQGYREHPGVLRAATVHNLGLPTICSTPAAATIYIPLSQ